MFAFLAAGALAGLASLGHCALMCGPLAACAVGRGRGTGVRLFRYLSARLAGYLTLGTLAGFGTETLFDYTSGWVSTLVSFSLAVALGVAAYRLWVPLGDERDDDLVALGRAPKRASLEDRLRRRLPAHPVALGALTALLPCGALYAAVLLAAASGSPMGGALTMLGFGVVSAFGLLAVPALGALASRLRVKPSLRAWASRSLALVLALGAIVLIARPFTSTGERSCHTHDEHVEAQAPPNQTLTSASP